MSDIGFEVDANAVARGFAGSTRHSAHATGTHLCRCTSRSARPAVCFVGVGVDASPRTECLSVRAGGLAGACFANLTVATSCRTHPAVFVVGLHVHTDAVAIGLPRWAGACTRFAAFTAQTKGSASSAVGVV